MDVRLIYNLGEANEYVFPYVYSIDDPVPGMKATIHEGNRADGSIVIPGGKESVDITLKGVLIGDDYSAIMTAISTMRTKVTSAVSTLSLQHYDEDTSAWVSDWSYTVRRIDKIKWDEDNLRTSHQKYELSFRVLVY